MAIILIFGNRAISRDAIGLTGNNNGLCECIALALVNVIIMYFCAFTTLEGNKKVRNNIQY